MAELVGYSWERRAGFVTLWDGTEIGIERGDTVAGYLTPCGSFILVKVFKGKPRVPVLPN